MLPCTVDYLNAYVSLSPLVKEVAPRQTEIISRRSLCCIFHYTFQTSTKDLSLGESLLQAVKNHLKKLRVFLTLFDEFKNIST